MVTILHGEDDVASRVVLEETLDSWTGEVVRADGKNLTADDLIQLFRTDDLFGKRRLIILEETYKTPIWSSLLSHLRAHSTHDHIILLEKHTVPSVSFQPLGNVVVREFKKNRLVFRWLDGLAPGSFKESAPLFHELLREREIAVVLFAMLVKRLVQLRTVHDGGISSLPDWRKRRLASQAERFSPAALDTLLDRCVRVERGQKTGRAVLGLETQIELLLAAIDRSSKVT